MRGVRLLVLWLAVAFAVRADLRSRMLAELVRADGNVERDHAAAVGEWRAARPGALFGQGDGVRTGGDGAARLRLKTGATMRLERNTRIRFSASTPGQSALRVETGEALVESGDQGLLVETSIGAAMIEPHSALRVLARDDQSARFEVTVGAAHLETASGSAEVTPDHAIEVSVGGAILEPVAATADANPKSAGDTKASDQPDNQPFLATVAGQGVRVKPRGDRAFKVLAAGDSTLSSGDTLQLPPGARVTLRHGAQQSVLVGDGQFVVGGSGGALVVAVKGKVDLQAHDEDVVVAVPGGTIRARADEGEKARADVEVNARATTVLVREGRVELQGQGGSQALRAGESGTLNAQGTLTANAAAAARADFGVAAGESFVVRDPHPPTAVGFDLAGVCPSEHNAGVVAVDGARVRGEGRASVLLSAGVHEYTVHCVGASGVDDSAAARGRVVVAADSGLASLPRQAPATLVDTDGRRYTVLYQNQLPSVDVRWPNAPASNGYALHVDAKRTTTTRASESLHAGTVGEGSHQIWFETADGSKHSDKTTLVLRFDNAAPTASVQEPANGGFHAGDTVHVSGVALEGWIVSVNGRELALDAQRRFAGDVTVPATDSGLAVKLVHATRGYVYYVRHAGGR